MFLILIWTASLQWHGYNFNSIMLYGEFEENILEINLLLKWKHCMNKYTVELQWLEHLWLFYYVCFELVLGSLGKIP